MPGQVRLEPASVDFRDVFVSEHATREVALFNGTTDTLTISAIELPEGPFEVLAPESVRAGRVAVVQLRFQPRTAGPHMAQAVLRTSARPMQIQLRGHGVAASLQVEPAEIDFGVVVIGSTATRAVTLKNLGDAFLELELDEGAGVGRCGVAAAGPFCVRQVGAVSLAPGQRVTFELRFAPTEVGAAQQTTLQFRSCPGCEGGVRLAGHGVAYGLSCAPAAFDFGDINPGECGVRTVRCENIGNQAVVIEDAQVRGDPRFSTDLDAGVAVGPRQTLSATVAFCPDDFGAAHGRLTLGGDQPAPGDAQQVSLEGRGGGPNLALSPAGLDFGLGAVGVITRRTVSMHNVGDRTLHVFGAEAIDDAPVWLDGGAAIEAGAEASLTVYSDHVVGWSRRAPVRCKVFCISR